MTSQSGTQHGDKTDASAILRGAGLALLAFLIFSTHDAVVKTLHGFSVFQIMFFAVLFAYVPFSTSLALDRTPRSLRPVNPGWVLLRGLTMTASAGFAFAAFSLLPMTQVYVLIFLAPMFISLLAIPLLGERIKIYRAAAIALGLVGVLIVMRPGTQELSLGHLFGFGAAACSAIAAVIARKVGREENHGTMIVVPMLINVLFTGCATVLFYQPMALDELLRMFAIGALGLLAQLCLLMAYRMAPAVVIAPFQYSQMIWAVVFGWLFFGDGIDRYTVIGSLITIGAGIFIVWRETQVSANQPNLRTRNLRGGALPPMQSVELDDDARDAAVQTVPEKQSR